MARAHVEPTGMELAYETRGDPRDPTALLLMGLSGSHIMWPLRLLEGLAAAGYHVVVYDHRDVGRSTVLHGAPGDLDTLRAAFAGWPFTPAYGLADLAWDALGLLDHLGADDAHVVGTSMGGMVAQHLAFAHPHRVRSLTSINSTPGLAVPDPPLEEPADVVDPRPPTQRARFLPWFVDGLRELSSPIHFDERETRELARAVWERGVHPDGNLRHLLAILADGDRTARLGRVTVPALVVHGAVDPLIDVAGGRATAAALPEASLHIVEDMAHDLPLPLVDDLARRIAAHLAMADHAAAAGGWS